MKSFTRLLLILVGFLSIGLGIGTAKAEPNLDALPQEVLILIAQQLTSIHDIHQLGLVSRAIRRQLFNATGKRVNIHDLERALMPKAKTLLGHEFTRRIDLEFRLRAKVKGEIWQEPGSGLIWFPLELDGNEFLNTDFATAQARCAAHSPAAGMVVRGQTLGEFNQFKLFMGEFYSPQILPDLDLVALTWTSELSQTDPAQGVAVLANMGLTTEMDLGTLAVVRCVADPATAPSVVSLSGPEEL